MAWFNLFSGPTVQRLEQNADALFADGFWGAAKLEYESALRKLKGAGDLDGASLSRLAGKIMDSKEALACEHQRNADQLLTSGQFEEALDLVMLALELTGDRSLKETLTGQQRAIETARAGELAPRFSSPPEEWIPAPEAADHSDPEDAFMVLCGTLPDTLQRAYQGYGAEFKKGYIALNNGDFETAVHYLSISLKRQNSMDSYIPLELATAYLHLNRLEEARQLLQTLLDYHPDALPAYQILCELYWEQGAFDQADALLAGTPDDLATSRALFILKGEAHFQAGRLQMAKTFYHDVLANYGWDEAIASALAKTHEALDEMDLALGLYQEILGHCSGCHSRVDPLVKEKVADLSFAAGIHDITTLEHYLALAQELPQKASGYYAKVSRIYHTLGNETEARRFLALADRMAVEEKEHGDS